MKSIKQALLDAGFINASRTTKGAVLWFSAEKNGEDWTGAITTDELMETGIPTEITMYRDGANWAKLAKADKITVSLLKGKEN